MVGQYDDVECNMRFAGCRKHGCDHHYALKRIKIYLKTGRHTIPATKFFLIHTTEGISICVVVLRVTETMITTVAERFFSQNW